MKKVKKIISICLMMVFVMSITTISIGDKKSLAQENLKESNEAQVFTDGDMGVFVITDTASKQVSLVSAKEQADLGYYSLPSTVLYNEVTYTVTGIQKDAFSKTQNLVDLVIPDSIKSIEEETFAPTDAFKIYCNPGSYAESFLADHQISAITNGFQIAIEKTVLNVGEEEKILVSQLPAFLKATDITWLSEDETIVSVNSEGFLKAIKVGETSIGAEVKGLTLKTKISVVELAQSTLETKNVETTVVDNSLENLTCLYQTSAIGKPWGDWVKDGKTSGTTGKSLALSALKIKFENENIAEDALSVQYQSYINGSGWQEAKTNGAISGDPNNTKFLEAFKINLIGEKSANYDIYYRAHSGNYGWLDWAKNGESAGTQGFNYQLEAIEVQIVKKGSPAPGETERPFATLERLQQEAIAQYQTHIQNIGWQGLKNMGEESGSTGRALRLEALKIKLPELGGNSSIRYKTHVENIGWKDWSENGEVSGTEGRGLRLEALQIELTGPLQQVCDIYYQVHAETYGWMDWAKNGEPAGTEGLSYRLESVRIQILPKGSKAPGKEDLAFVSIDQVRKGTNINYQAHVQNIGWQEWRSNGNTSGTSGQSLRIEAIQFSLNGLIRGSEVYYAAQVENVGWQNWQTSGQISGTTGNNLRMETIRIQLGGMAEKLFDVYYQVHVQDIGWMDWAKNGGPAGTEGGALRMEAINVRLVPKGGAAPGPTANPYRKIVLPPAPNCIVINIDKQNMKLYRNNQIIVDTPVTTGLAGRYDTPRGNFAIYEKSRNVVLRGPGYASFVSFWMPFYEDYGIHDATWRSNFGGNVYQWDGSHGCVNTPLGNATTIFNNIDVGTPVFIQ